MHMRNDNLQRSFPPTEISRQVEALVSCLKAAGDSRFAPSFSTVSELFHRRLPDSALPVVITSNDEMNLVQTALLEVAGQFPGASGAREILKIADAIENAAINSNIIKFSVSGNQH
jgi:hypothetical protein